MSLLSSSSLRAVLPVLLPSRCWGPCEPPTPPSHSGSCWPCSQGAVLQIPHLLRPEAGSGTLPSPRRSVRLLEQQCRPCSRSREHSWPLSTAAMCGILLVLPSCTQNCWVLVGVGNSARGTGQNMVTGHTETAFLFMLDK